MELRHLRCFVVLAEELHFTRAAERLHIEQPPLSRTIKELEDDIGLMLFDRDRRGTRLTAAGTAFLQDTRRLFTVLEQARENAKAVAAGLQGSLRIAISDGVVDRRLSAFLAHCREEEPEIEIKLSEVPLAEQLRGLRTGDFVAGLAHTAEIDDEIIAEPLWQDSLVIAVPARHELLAHKEIPLDELGKHPIVLCDSQVCEGYCRQLARLCRPLARELKVVEQVSSLDMMLTLVGAGFGLGFTTQTKSEACQRPDVVIRPLAAESAIITTYLLRLSNVSLSALLKRFIHRLQTHMCE